MNGYITGRKHKGYFTSAGFGCTPTIKICKGYFYSSANGVAQCYENRPNAVQENINMLTKMW